MSIVRYLGDNGIDRQVTFLYGARTQADIIFHSECLELASSKSSFQYFVTLSQPDATWEGESGRLSWEQIQKQCGEGIAESRYFLCGPNDFMDAVSKLLTENGVTTDRIHTEAFHKAKVEVAATTEGA